MLSQNLHKACSRPDSCYNSPKKPSDESRKAFLASKLSFRIVQTAFVCIVIPFIFLDWEFMHKNDSSHCVKVKKVRKKSFYIMQKQKILTWKAFTLCKRLPFYSETHSHTFRCQFRQMVYAIMNKNAKITKRCSKNCQVWNKQFLRPTGCLHSMYKALRTSEEIQTSKCRRLLNVSLK